MEYDEFSKWESVEMRKVFDAVLALPCELRDGKPFAQSLVFFQADETELIRKNTGEDQPFAGPRWLSEDPYSCSRNFRRFFAEASGQAYSCSKCGHRQKLCYGGDRDLFVQLQLRKNSCYLSGPVRAEINPSFPCA